MAKQINLIKKSVMKRFYSFINLLLIFGIATGCVVKNQRHLESNVGEKLMVATLFHQHAAEMKALSYQAYNIATERLDEILSMQPAPANPAVVLDLDETVLDNSPHQAQGILYNFAYPEGWAEWCKLGEAPALPGAVDFLQYAVDRGVAVFYISNRKEEFREATKTNFVRENIPLQSDAHLMLRTAESGKEKRRLAVLENYQIVFLIGDNLSDFHQVFDHQTSERRAFLADSLKADFGRRFIIIPNAMYGDWLTSLQDYNYLLSTEELDILYRSLLKGFNYEKPKKY